MVKISVRKIAEESTLLNRIPKETYLTIESEVFKLQSNSKAKRVLLFDKEAKSIVTKIDYNNTNTEKKIAEFNRIIKENGGFYGSLSYFNDNMHVSVIAECFLLVIVFDEDSSFGLVRLSLNKSELEALLLTLVLEAKSDSLLNDKLFFLLSPFTDSELDELDFFFDELDFHPF
jgi:hypothetical protein